MPLTLHLKSAEDKVYGGTWVRRGRPTFMRSAAYETLERSLWRYLRQETAGFSCLIAGHRGVGKTALVTEVVEAVTDELFYQWNRWAADWDVWAEPRPRPVPPSTQQRPLLVKLYGPSLVGKELPSPGGGEEPRAKPAATPTTRRWAGGSVVEVNVAPAATERAAADPDTRSTATGRAHSALVQMMIGLYRALAREIGEAAATRVLRSGPEQQEWAAQLRFELDRTASPETLKDLWDALEPEQCGLLWPRHISLAMQDRLVAPDQQMREVVAVATAAQAFQVCSGAVTYNQTRKESSSQERSVEVKAGLDAKDAVNRLAALGIGGLIGWGIAGPAGAGVGLLGSLGVTSLSKRSSKRERGEDYTFIVDRSVQTLERDLPLVIDRVRAAGLAPVFLVDELDKLLATGDGSVADSVRELINRLKHLTTDYGFFCFLTDRDYFDEIERKLGKLGEQRYPVEHTFFSERLLVGYRPDDFARYGSAVIRAGVPGEEFAKYLLVKEMVLTSRLNTTDFHRALRRDWRQSDDGSPVYWLEAPAIAGSTPHLLAAAVQSAIEIEFNNEHLIMRVQGDAGFRQAATDTLYRIVRSWDKGADTVDLSKAAIARELLASRNAAKPGTKTPEQAAAEDIGQIDFDELCEMVGRLAGSLNDFQFAIRRLRQSPVALTHDEAIFQSLYERDIGRVIYSGSEPARFAYRRDGTDRSARQTNAAILVEKSGAVLSALTRASVGFDDLTMIGWPPTLTIAEVEKARASTESLIGHDDVEANRAALPLREFLEALKRLRLEVAGLAALRADVFREAELTKGQRPGPYATHDDWFNQLVRYGASVTPALWRYLPNPSAQVAARPLADGIDGIELEVAYPPEVPNDSPGYPIDPETMRAWADAISGRNSGRLSADITRLSLEARAQRSWGRWYVRIAAYLSSGEPGEAKAHFDDLVLAAAGLLPSRLLHHDLSRLDPLAWTTLVLATLASQGVVPGSSAPRDDAALAPVWMAVAGLRQLGFGRPALTRLLGRLPAVEEELKKAFALLPGARDEGASAPTAPNITVTATELEAYKSEIMWLRQIVLLQAGGREDG